MKDRTDCSKNAAIVMEGPRPGHMVEDRASKLCAAAGCLVVCLIGLKAGGGVRVVVLTCGSSVSEQLSF